ncbi:MAG: hypothetical protein NZ703_03845 [Gemmataceae bacterium]|nr:hypothetical protein [Gemmataceae bacterium]MCS7270195.1 hypothetical protein [Gemmataceae bacterium]MDW8242929.1 hypothetical protein [Thermogemmata sp.]
MNPVSVNNDRLTLLGSNSPTVTSTPGNGIPGVVARSVFSDSLEEANKHKWIESQKAGYDLGESCIREWVAKHWQGYLRARWVEHLQGKCFWVELDRGDFGLLQREFHDCKPLLDAILDQLAAGKENLHVILWAMDTGQPIDQVLRILEALDINSIRLRHQFESRE